MLTARALRVLRYAPRRSLGTTARSLPSAVYTSPGQPQDASTTHTPEDITESQRSSLDAALRIDQAGEIAANYIYMGQLAVLGKDRVCGPLITVSTSSTLYICVQLCTLCGKEMWDQEKKHLAVMNKLQLQHRVRPTVLWEVAKVAGYGLGAVTALMGKEAAMACTEAVETVIGEHYDECVTSVPTLLQM